MPRHESLASRLSVARRLVAVLFLAVLEGLLPPSIVDVDDLAVLWSAKRAGALDVQLAIVLHIEMPDQLGPAYAYVMPVEVR